MIRGSILKNGDKFYVLVRSEIGEAKNANGVTLAKQARYNLVNLGDGKTRVSTPDRMFLQHPDVDEVSLVALRAHFNLPHLEDTGVTMQEINVPKAVTEAVAAKERARLQAATADANDVINRLVSQLISQRTVCLW